MSLEKAEKKRLEANVDDLKESLDAASASIMDMEMVRDSVSSKIMSTISESVLESANSTDLDTLLSVLIAEHDNAKVSLRTSIADKVGLENQLQELDAKMADISERMHEREIQISDLYAENTSYNNSLDDANRVVEELKCRWNDLENDSRRMGEFEGSKTVNIVVPILSNMLEEMSEGKVPSLSNALSKQDSEAHIPLEDFFYIFNSIVKKVQALLGLLKNSEEERDSLRIQLNVLREGILHFFHVIEMEKSIKIDQRQDCDTTRVKELELLLEDAEKRVEELESLKNELSIDKAELEQQNIVMLEKLRELKDTVGPRLQAEIVRIYF